MQSQFGFCRAGRRPDLSGSGMDPVRPSGRFHILGMEGDGDEQESEEEFEHKEDTDQDIFGSNVEDDDDHEVYEGRKAKSRGKTYEPTQEEFDEHVLTHIPFRSWCAHCVRGKAKNNPHFKRSIDMDAVPMICVDYTWMGEGE